MNPSNLSKKICASFSFLLYKLPMKTARRHLFGRVFIKMKIPRAMCRPKHTFLRSRHFWNSRYPIKAIQVQITRNNPKQSSLTGYQFSQNLGFRAEPTARSGLDPGNDDGWVGEDSGQRQGNKFITKTIISGLDNKVIHFTLFAFSSRCISQPKPNIFNDERVCDLDVLEACHDMGCIVNAITKGQLAFFDEFFSYFQRWKILILTSTVYIFLMCSLLGLTDKKDINENLAENCQMKAF